MHGGLSMVARDLTVTDTQAAHLPPDQLVAWCPACIATGRAKARKAARDRERSSTWAEIAGVDQPPLPI